jgi:ABC-type amino acid transport substrate-binding protein
MTMKPTSVLDLRRRRARTSLFASLLFWMFAAGPAMAGGTLDRVKESGKLTIGYLAEAQPYSFADASGKPAGYAIALCARVAYAVKEELKLPALAVDFVQVRPGEGFGMVQQGRADLLCGGVPTLERRKLVDFSIPILLSGTGAAVRADAPARLVLALSGREPATQAYWRATPGQAPERRVFAAIAGTPVEKALIDRLKALRVSVEVVTVKDTAAGLQMLLDRRADAFFNDQALLLDAAKRSPSGRDLIVLDRLFRREQVALAMRRDDGDFRLVVDRTLSRLFQSPEAGTVYATHFGAPTEGVLNFFQVVALPD